MSIHPRLALLHALRPSLMLARLVPAAAQLRTLVAPAPPVPFRVIARRFWPYARPHLPWFVVGLAAVVAVPLIEAVEIWLFQLVVDQVLVPRDLGPFAALAAAFIGLTILSGAVSFADDVIAARVTEGFVLSVRTSLFAHLVRLSPDAHQGRHLGDVLTRLTGDVQAIERFLVTGLATAVAAIARIVFYAGALFLIDPPLAIVSLIVAPLFWGAARSFAGVIRRVSREKRRRSGALTAVAEETLGNLALIQASEREDDRVARLRHEGEAIRDASLAATKLRGLLTPIVDILEVIGALVVVGLGTLALTDGRVTLGSLLVFLTYLTQLYGPVRELAELGTDLYAASAGAERIIELLDQEPAVRERPGARRTGRARGAIELRGVTYRYPGADRDALSDVDLRIRPGESVAVVGESGAGKSTLLKLLLRFADPDRGTVRLDGDDLRDLTLASVRSNVAALLQESLVLDTSAEENIRLGRPDAPPEAIRSAACDADADGFLAALPDGYATRLGQRGRRLSAGQRQRVAIARLLLRDAPVVVLDEPSTGLDARSADRSHSALTRLMADRTTIVISHDPAWVRDADRIVVLDRGRIVEEGTHDVLVASHGTYARLWGRSTATGRANRTSPRLRAAAAALAAR